MEQQMNTEGIVDINREFLVKEPLFLEDGKHTGIITNIIYRDFPYSYMDVVIRPDNVDMDLKVGYPQVISPTSSLGELLTRFGINLVKDLKIKPHNVLIDKKVEFVTISEAVKMKDGKVREFSRIVRESLKPTKN